MHYFEESFKYYPANFDNLIVLGFLYFREEIYEKAIKFFELAFKVQPNAFIAEIQYGKCYQKLGNNKEAFRVFKRIHNKYSDNKETLTYLISLCRDLNLPYDEFYQKLNRLDRESMLSDQYQNIGGGYDNVEYGQPIYSNQKNFGIAADPNYKGVDIDYSLFTRHNQPNTNTKSSNYLKFNISPDELLPP